MARPKKGGLLTCPHAEEVLNVAGVHLVDETDVYGQDRRI
jgi:hypothetical protein